MNSFANTIRQFFLNRRKSFGHALDGCIHLFSSETNAKVHLFAAFIAVLLAILLRFSLHEWVCLVLTIGWVLFAEAVNTVIEKLVDFIHPNYHSTIKIIKDISAGAVLITAISASIIGLLLFIPKILKLLL